MKQRARVLQPAFCQQRHVAIRFLRGCGSRRGSWSWTGWTRGDDEGHDRACRFGGIAAFDQFDGTLADRLHARPMRAGVQSVVFSAGWCVYRQQLQSDAQRARLVMQRPREHAQRGSRDRTMGVARPRLLAPRAADQHITAAAAGLGEQRQKMPSRRKMRQQVLI